MTLRQKQSQFARMLAHLILFIYSQGYEVTFARYAKRAKWSLHKKQLAKDLNLFLGGRYLRTTKAHLRFGEFWEHLGGTWGGRFKDSKGRAKPDGNHYSLEHRGVK